MSAPSASPSTMAARRSAPAPNREQEERVKKAHRAYVRARYEWLRLRAVAAGYLAPSGHKPLALQGNESLAEIQTRTGRVREWLNNNQAPEEVAPQAAPEPAREPKKFAIPSGARKVACKSCGGPMFWVQTEAGKVAPVNPDGTSHFGNCPGADNHRKAENRDTKKGSPQPALWDGDNESPSLARASTKAQAHEQSEPYGTARAASSKPDLRPLWAAIHAAKLPAGDEHRTNRLKAVNARLRADDRFEIDSFKELSEDALSFLIRELEEGRCSWN